MLRTATVALFANSCVGETVASHTIGQSENRLIDCKQLVIIDYQPSIINDPHC